MLNYQTIQDLLSLSTLNVVSLAEIVIWFQPSTTESGLTIRDAVLVIRFICGLPPRATSNILKINGSYADDKEYIGDKIET